MSARRESSIARMKLVNSRADFATESIEAANAVECLFRTLRRNLPNSLLTAKRTPAHPQNPRVQARLRTLFPLSNASDRRDRSSQRATHPSPGPRERNRRRNFLPRARQVLVSRRHLVRHGYRRWWRMTAQRPLVPLDQKANEPRALFPLYPLKMALNPTHLQT